MNKVDPWGLLNAETGVTPGDLIDIGLAAGTQALVNAEKIPPALVTPFGGPLGLLLAPTSDLLLPNSVNTNEDFELHMIELDLYLTPIELELQDIIDQYEEMLYGPCD